MKKMLLVLLAAGLSFGAAQAQTTTATPAAKAQGRMAHKGQHKGQDQRTPEQRADMHTQRMTKQLSLSADQQAQVRTILLAQASEVQALRSQMTPGSGERQAVGLKMKDIQARTDEQLKSVLTTEQYTRYDQVRDDRMEHRADKKAEMKTNKKKEGKAAKTKMKIKS